MRVVAGSAKGRRLEVPVGRRLRPTTDRVREAVFSSIASRGEIDGARVVDLFAGTGAMGIEALSRGATAATFVEADPATAAAIEANLAGTGLSGRATVVRGDVLRFLTELVLPAPGGRSGPVLPAPGGRSGPVLPAPGGRSGPGLPAPGGRSGPGELFDVAFADPPYKFTGWPALLERLAAALAGAGDGGSGLAVLESRGAVDVGTGWMTVKTLRHGDTVVTFARPH